MELLLIDVAQVFMNLLWFEFLLLMRLWVWNAYLVLLWNRALAYPRAEYDDFKLTKKTVVLRGLYKKYFSVVMINPWNPHDALKHHFTSLKTDLIFLQLGVIEWIFPSNWFTNAWQFFLLFHPHQIIFIHYSGWWRWQCKVTIDRVNTHGRPIQQHP